MSRETLTEKQKELVAISASIAAGCRPCTDFHVAAAREAGVADAEIRVAVDNALAVRDSARNGIAARAYSLLGESAGSACTGCSPPRDLHDELVSVAAAYAINSVVDLEAHLADARSAGATEAQIATALSISRMVKKVAAEKVEAVVTGSPDNGVGASVCSLADAAGEDDTAPRRAARRETG